MIVRYNTQQVKAQEREWGQRRESRGTGERERERERERRGVRVPT